MTGNEPGWYRDPAPPNPAFPTTLRYWDGEGWTSKVKHASKAEREAWHRELVEQRMLEAAEVAGAAAEAARNGTATAQQAALLQASSRVATPDGQALSGWWRRVFASWIDSVLVLVAGTVLGWSWLREAGSAYRRYVDLLVSTPPGAPMPDPEPTIDALMGPLAAFGLLVLALRFGYDVLFLKGFGATPGKMVVGIEVRLRDRPGPMPWSTVLVRWFTQNAFSVLRLVPVIMTSGVVPLLGGVYMLVDCLWPLWDPRRQALHDKVARTNVVRRG